MVMSFIGLDGGRIPLITSLIAASWHSDVIGRWLPGFAPITTIPIPLGIVVEHMYDFL
jgi:hypothetical protein